MHHILIFDLPFTLFPIFQAHTDDFDSSSRNSYNVSGPHGQADNAISEMVDLRGIYVVDNSSVHNGGYHVVNSEIPQTHGSTHGGTLGGTHGSTHIKDNTHSHYASDSQSNSLTVPHYIGSKPQDSALNNQDSALDNSPLNTGSGAPESAPDYGGSTGSVHINGAEQLVS